jgi:hypothetical protein
VKIKKRKFEFGQGDHEAGTGNKCFIGLAPAELIEIYGDNKFISGSKSKRKGTIGGCTYVGNLIKDSVEINTEILIGQIS